MKLSVIGRYGPYAQKGGATSCYALNGSVIMDMGSGSLSRLIGKTDLKGISAIILTHLHSDHISDMFTLRYYYGLEEKAGRFKGKIKVYMPVYDCPEYAMLSSCKYFDIQGIKNGEIINAGGLEIVFFEMLHAGIPCFGLKIREGNTVLGYTADTLYCKNLESLLAGCNAAICDSAVLKKDFFPGSPHISVYDMAKLCKKYNVRMLISHISDAEGLNALEEAKKAANDCLILSENTDYEI